MVDPHRTVEHTPEPNAGADTTVGGTPQFELTELSPPGSTSRYAIGEEIARGGMGAVYHATDTVLCREVAIKVLQEKFAPTSATAQRFFDEARITAQLQHPAIPPVHDLGTLPDGRPFLAMKLIHGQTLSELLTPEQRVDTRRSPNLVAVFEQICLALAFAHSRGIIHRDLKPSNVMVGAFGEVQVMDWGLARETRNAERGMRSENQESDLSSIPHSEFRTPHSEDRTQFGQAVGTPAFMPPEQARGELENIDTRSDVFGLGGILCAILTGKPPYTKAGLAVLRQAGNADLAAAFNRLDASGADPELIALCKRCLNGKRDDRPTDAGVVAKAVGELRAAAEERARQAELERVKAETEVRAQRRRRRLQLALAAAAALLFAASGAFAWWQDRQAREARERVERNADALTELVTRCETALQQGKSADAAAALEEIDRRLPEGGGEPLAERITQCRTDLLLLRELVIADEFFWNLRDGRQPHPSEVAARWKAAFERVGLTPAAPPATVTPTWLRTSNIRERALGSLDMWHWAIPPNTPERATLRAVLSTTDPDTYREAIRTAIATQDSLALARLSEQPDALVQPPRFTILFAQIAAAPVARRRAILEAALRRTPGNLTLLMSMAMTHRGDRTPVGVAERLRWSQAAVAAHPESLLAREELAVNLSELDLDRSISEFHEILRLDPDFTNAAGNLAVVLGYANKDHEALAVCREAVRRNPGVYWYHELLGNNLVRIRDYPAAIAAYLEAIRLNPNSAAAHSGLSVAHYELKQPDLALAAAQKAIQVTPEFTQGHVALGMARSLNKDPNGAIAAFREAIRLSPNNALAHANLGGTLTFKRQFQEAEAACKEAIRLNPQGAFGHAKLAQVYLQQNKFKEAAKAARTAVQLDPQIADAQGILATALVQLKDYVGAREALASLQKLDPKHQLLFMAAFLEQSTAPEPREVKR